MKRRGGLLASLLALALGACSSPVPTDSLRTATDVMIDVSVPLGRAPGLCGEVTEFGYIAVTTLRKLGFVEFRADLDYNRLGRFWVTAEALDIPMPREVPGRPPARMLCVEWADGNVVGMETMALPDDWAVP